MSEHYVYIAWSADRHPLYVGCTNNVERRLREHKGYSGWHSAAVTYSILEYPTRKEALKAESRQIAKLRPPNNVRCNPRFQTVAEAVAANEWFEEFDRLNRLGGVA